jgi:dihydrofolate synthase/folylpolyglutamate synthase
MMTYQQTIDYLYAKLPMFQRIGEKAYKKDLHNTLALCEFVENPQNKLKCVHIAGTNGKGSSSHLIAAILQSAGYKTGLYTSPHLKKFTERIKINGKEINEEFIIDFVEKTKPIVEEISPSFFELTTVMAFDYFAQHQVDIAIIETGLGGRLDCTNVICPEVSLITNISFDHQNILGDTLAQIAFEKAGIIKNSIPCVISELQDEIKGVFENKTTQTASSLFFASEEYALVPTTSKEGEFDIFKNKQIFLAEISCELKGAYQSKNLCGVLKTVELLKNYPIEKEHIRHGIANVVTLTGLKGRWQKLGENPLIICDTAHNEGGIKEVIKQFATIKYSKLHCVYGAVNDKDLSKILALLPKDAYYYFCKPNIPRGLEAHILYAQAQTFGLVGEVFGEVSTAFATAQARAHATDMIFVGGSTFVVAEIL